MFSLRAVSRLITFLVTLAVIVSTASAVRAQDNPPPTTAPTYQPVAVDGLRVGFGDDANTDNPGTAVTQELLTGDSVYGFFASLYDTGMAAPLEDVKVTVTYPKSEVFDGWTGFREHDLAQRFVTRQDNNNYYADYYFDRIEQGADIRLQMSFSFISYSTLPGSTYTPTIEVFVGGTSYATNSVTFLATINPSFYGQNEITDGVYNHADGSRWDTPWHWFFVDDLATQGSRTPSEGIPITYRVRQMVSNPRSYGAIDIDRYRFTIQLTENILPHADSLAAGWVHDPVAKTLTFEASEDVNACRAYYGPITFCQNVTLLYANAPIATDGTWNGEPIYYAPELTVTHFAQGTEIHSRKENLPLFSFVAKENPKFPGRTSEIKLSSGSVPNSEFAEDVSGSGHYVFDGNVYRGNINLGPGGENPRGMELSTVIKQENNGSNFNPVPVGGRTDTIKKITANQIDWTAYYQQLWLGRPIDGFVKNSSVTEEEAIARINDSENVVWGVTQGGERVELARNIDLNQRVRIGDKEKRFSAIEVEFVDGIVMDNFQFQVHVGVLPTQEELDRWSRINYYNYEMYSSDTIVEYLTEGQADTATQESSRSATLQTSSRRLSLINSSGDVNIDYVRCERIRAQGGTMTNEAELCEKPFTVDIKTSTSTDYNSWGPYNLPIQNYRHLYLLPPGLEFVELASARAGSLEATAQPQVDIINDFKGTGKTGVLLSFGDVAHLRGAHGGGADSTIKVRVTPQATGGSHTISRYAYWDNNNMIQAGNLLRYDRLDLDGDNNTDEEFLGVDQTVNLTMPTGLQVTKKVSVNGGPYLTQTVFQEIGKPVNYEITIKNIASVPQTEVQVYDILPHTADVSLDVRGYAAYRTWARNGVVQRHSGFGIPLAGPITQVRSIKDGVVSDATGRIQLHYATGSPQVGDGYWTYSDDLTEWLGEDSRWSTADEVNNWKEVSAFRLGMKPGESLAAGETLVITTENVVHSASGLVANGTKALNSVLYGSGTNVVETKPLAVEILNYRVRGVAFEDTDGNGLRGATEPVLPDVPYALVDAATGEPVIGGDGNPVTGVTNGSGAYAIQVPTRGEYRVRFEKPAEKVFSTLGEGVKAAHVAVCADRADNLAGASGFAGFINRVVGRDTIGATGTNCESSSASHNNVGWTSAFALGPMKSLETRNVGFSAPTGTVTINKKDQHGQPVAGVEFRLEWKAAQGDTPSNLPAQLTAVTNEAGVATIAGLPLGEYTLTETRVPAGYRGMEAPLEVVVTRDTAPVQVINQAIEVGLTVTMLDHATGQPVSGIHLELRDLNGVVVGPATLTNDQGQVTFPSVRPGEYLVAEVQPGAGGSDTTGVIRSVSVPANGQVADIEMTNQPIRGSVSLIATSAGTGSPLPGATFELRAEDGRVVDTQVSGHGGVVTFVGVELGSYTVVQTAAPAGFQPTIETKRAEVSLRDQAVDLGAVENQPIGTQVEFTVVNTKSGAPLAGVEYELRQGDRVVAKTSSNEQGLVRFNSVVNGSYQVVEVAAPAGYPINATPIDVEVTATSPVRLPEVRHASITGEVSFVKADGPTRKPLAGAVFSLQTPKGVELDSQTSGEDGRVVFTGIEPGTYHVREVRAPEGYQPLSAPLIFEMNDKGEPMDLGEVGNVKATGVVQLTTVDARTQAPVAGVEYELRRGEELIDRQWSNQDGVVRFPWVDYGDYTLVQTNPAPGYQAAEYRAEVRIREQDQLVDLGRVEASPLVGSVAFSTVDQLTGGPVGGAVFSLLQGGQVVAVAEANSDGLVTFPNVAHGAYYLRQTQAPAGYVLDTQDREVIVGDPETVVLENLALVPYVSTVFFTAVDADSREPLLGARFGLFNDKAEQVAEMTTAANGRVAFAKVRPGTYTVVELSAPTGYQRIGEPMEVTVGAEGRPVDLGEIANDKQTGTVSLSKVDAVTKQPLAGAVYQLRQGDRVVAEQATGIDGVVTFDRVPLGDYTLVETAPAPGYPRSTDTHQVEVSEHGGTVSLGIVETQPTTGTIELVRRDAQTKAPLAGAVFALMQNDTEIARVTSGADGVVRFATAQPGEYTLLELTAPTGYQGLREPLRATVGAAGGAVNLGEVANQKITGTITLTNVDVVDPNLPLRGVRFALVDAAGTVMQEKTTDNQGKVTFRDVPFGTYTVVEAQAKEGYEGAPMRREVTISEHGKTVDLGSVGNTRIKGAVALTVVEAGTARALEGVSMQLRTPGGEVVAAGKTNAQGELKFSDVAYGNYVLVENAALPGYRSLAEPIQVKVAENGITVQVGEVAKERIRGTITLQAVDKVSKNPIAGAVFELLSSEGKAVAKAVSGKDGRVTFTDQAWGNYTVVESAAPSGYQTSVYRATVAVHDHGATVDLGLVRYAETTGITPVPAPEVTGGFMTLLLPILGLFGLGALSWFLLGSGMLDFSGSGNLLAGLWRTFAFGRG